MFDNITTDGTFTLTESGEVRNALEGVMGGFVVAIGALESPEDVKPGDTFGRWEDTETGRVFWDRVQVLDNIGDALVSAEAIGELAIWDVANSKEIRLTA